MPDEPAHPLIAAAYNPATWLAERTLFRPYRAYLVEDLQGSVLDIGAGTGAMFPYFVEHAEHATFHAIEPDPYMRKRAQKRANRLDLDIEIRDARAEALPYDAGTFDVVIASLVFCTIEDPQKAVQEVTRVLKPNGEFRFFEHVADHGWRGTLQRILAPFWRRAAGGYHLARHTQHTFVNAEPLEIIELERRLDGLTPVRPFVRGRMYRP